MNISPSIREVARSYLDDLGNVDHATYDRRETNSSVYDTNVECQNNELSLVLSRPEPQQAENMRKFTTTLDVEGGRGRFLFPVLEGTRATCVCKPCPRVEKGLRQLVRSTPEKNALGPGFIAVLYVIHPCRTAGLHVDFLLYQAKYILALLVDAAVVYGATELMHGA